jgi:hypothetical protein
VQEIMSKKPKKPKKESLPAPEKFAARHGIAVETARAILSATDQATSEADGASMDPS